jgi:hypothetical protein
VTLRGARTGDIRGRRGSRHRETESGPRQARGSGVESALRPKPTPRDASSVAATRPSACRGQQASASRERIGPSISRRLIGHHTPCAGARALGVAFVLNCRPTWHRAGKQFNMLSFLPQAFPVLNVLNMLSIVALAGRSA